MIKTLFTLVLAVYLSIFNSLVIGQITYLFSGNALLANLAYLFWYFAWLPSLNKYAFKDKDVALIFGKLDKKTKSILDGIFRK